MSGVNAAAYREVLAIPQRRAALRLRMCKRTLIEKLHEIFREKNINAQSMATRTFFSVRGSLLQ
jgi:hypothetical protein